MSRPPFKVYSKARPQGACSKKKTHTHSPRRSTPEASHPDPAGQMAPLHVEMSEMPGSSPARRTNQAAWSCWWVCGVGIVSHRR